MIFSAQHHAIHANLIHVVQTFFKFFKLDSSADQLSLPLDIGRYFDD